MWKTIAVVALCWGCVLSTATVASADDRASLLALQHFDRLGSYRIAVTTRHVTETTIQNITFVAPDREADYLPAMHQTNVTIGNETWIRRDDGTWSKTGLSLALTPALRSRASFERSIRNATVTKLDVGELEGVKVQHFRFDIAARGKRRAWRSDLWLGTADGFPRRQTMTMGETSESGIFSSFGERLTIPIPPGK